MNLIKREITYRFDAIHFKSYCAHPKTNQPLPAVLIFPDYSGRSSHMCQTAEKLAKAGYLAIAIDIYGEAKVGKDKTENLSLMTPLVENRHILQNRLRKTFEETAKIALLDTHRTAAIGFCFGGLCVLDMARMNLALKGVISFHGILSANPPDLDLKGKMSPRVMVLHGHDDPMVTPEAVLAFEKEMCNRRADWQIHVYGNTMHAFTNPDANDMDFGIKYNPRSAKRAWQSALSFLQETV